MTAHGTDESALLQAKKRVSSLTRGMCVRQGKPRLSIWDGPRPLSGILSNPLCSTLTNRTARPFRPALHFDITASGKLAFVPTYRLSKGPLGILEGHWTEMPRERCPPLFPPLRFRGFRFPSLSQSTQISTFSSKKERTRALAFGYAVPNGPRACGVFACTPLNFFR